MIGSALPIIGNHLGDVPHNEPEIITAGRTIGAVFGSAILGGLADKLGRKRCMGIAGIFFTIGAILLGASSDVPMAKIARIILGVGVGGLPLIGPVYITELAATHIRRRTVGTCTLLFLLVKSSPALSEQSLKRLFPITSAGDRFLPLR